MYSEKDGPGLFGTYGAMIGENKGGSVFAGFSTDPLAGVATTVNLSTPVYSFSATTDTHGSLTGGSIATPGKFGASAGITYTCVLALKTGLNCR